MTSYAPEAATSSGLAPTARTPNVGTGDRVPQGCLLMIKTTGTATTLGLVTAGTVDGDLAIADRSIVMPATGDRFVRVPTLDAYRDPADGLVGLTWTSATGVTFYVVS